MFGTNIQKIFRNFVTYIQKLSSTLGHQHENVTKIIVAHFGAKNPKMMGVWYNLFWWKALDVSDRLEIEKSKTSFSVGINGPSNFLRDPRQASFSTLMKCMISPGPSRSVFSERYLVLVQPGLSRRSLISQNFLVLFLNFSKYLVLILTAKKVAFGHVHKSFLCCGFNLLILF